MSYLTTIVGQKRIILTNIASKSGCFLSIRLFRLLSLKSGAGNRAPLHSGNGLVHIWQGGNSLEASWPLIPRRNLRFLFAPGDSFKLCHVMLTPREHLLVFDTFIYTA